jgi:heme exporter protein C
VWWRSLHQQATVLRLGKPTIAGSMLATLLLAFVAFSLAYGYLMAVRMRVGRLEDRSAVPVSSLSAPRARRPRPAAGIPAAAAADVPAPAPADVPTSVASDSHA